MPIYEYKCGVCSDVSERIEKSMNGQEPPPLCCKQPTSKLVSAACFDFRGSGFYTNEYGSGAHKLDTTSQAQRASVDCENAGIVASQPQTAGPELADKLVERKIEKYGNSAKV